MLFYNLSDFGSIIWEIWENQVGYQGEVLHQKEVRHWIGLPMEVFMAPSWQSSRSIWTTVSDIGLEFWMALCGARGWTWWPLWVPTNLWYSVILWDYFTGKLEAVLIHGVFFPLFVLRIWWEVKAYNRFLFTFIPNCLRHKFGHYVYTSLRQ